MMYLIWYLIGIIPAFIIISIVSSEEKGFEIIDVYTMSKKDSFLKEKEYLNFEIVFLLSLIYPITLIIFIFKKLHEILI